MDTLNKYQIHSHDVQELLGQVPRWIVRWGTLSILFVLVLLFILSNILVYPDVIHSQVQLTANIPPAEMKANSEGSIKKILVADKQQVDSGQLLAVIHSSADYNDVIYLSGIISGTFSMEQVIDKSIFKKEMKLGNLQALYASFIQTIEEYHGFVDVDYYMRKIKSMDKELLRYQQYLTSLKEKNIVLENEYVLSNNQFNRDSLLADQGVLSKSDLEKSTVNRLGVLYKIKESEASISEAAIEISNLDQEKLELILQLEKQNQELYSRLKARWEELRGEIAQWRKDYLIEAPFDGKVSLSKIWSENQYVNKGEVVLMVLPEKFTRVMGRLKLQPTGIGKIKENNKVIIQFDNYPHMEYGVVTGKISKISLAPEDGFYYAIVTLDSTNLVTNYNITLSFSQSMQGNAEIITESRSLFNRIVAPLKSSFEKQKMYR